MHRYAPDCQLPQPRRWNYLFLMVDINQPEEPRIYVHTWQPQRDFNLTPNLLKNEPDAGVYSIYYFE